MTCVCLWYGGYSYAAPSQDDVEVFSSLRQAAEVFDAREHNRDGRTPCVEGSEMHVYFGEYTENGPDRIIRRGPRGGLVIERC